MGALSRSANTAGPRGVFAYRPKNGTQVDASRLQQQIQDCSAFLKKVRELVSLESGETGKLSLAEAAKKLKERSL